MGEPVVTGNLVSINYMMDCGWADDIFCEILHLQQQTDSPPSRQLLLKICSQAAHMKECQHIQHRPLLTQMANFATKDFMKNVVQVTTNNNNATKLLEYLISGTGGILIRALSKLGVIQISSAKKMNRLLLFLLKLRQSPELEQLDSTDYEQVCSDSLCLITQLSETSNSVAMDALQELTATLDNLMLERSECVAIDAYLSVSSLIMDTVRCFARISAAINDNRKVEESGIFSVMSEIASVYLGTLTKTSDVSNQCKTLQANILFEVMICLTAMLQTSFYKAKLQSIVSTMDMFTRYLALADQVVAELVKYLLLHNEEEKLDRLAKSSLEVIYSMKLAKVKYIHSMTCQKKKHRKCDTLLNIHHHHNVLTDNDSLHACNVAHAVEVLLNLFSGLPSTSHAKTLIANGLKNIGACCCMQEEVFLKHFLCGIADLPNTLQRSTLSAVTFIFDHVLSGTINSVNCQYCSANAKVRWTSLYLIYEELMKSLATQTPVIIIKEINRINATAGDELSYQLYRQVYRPLLENLLSQTEDICKDTQCLLHHSVLALSSILQKEDARDHFLSSATSMQLLGKCATIDWIIEDVLTVLEILLVTGEDDANVSLPPLFNLIMGEPEISKKNFEFLYQIPDLAAVFRYRQDTRNMLARWRTCCYLLQHSIIFRNGFHSRNGPAHAMKLLSAVLETILCTEKADQVTHCLSLLELLINILITCALNGLSIARKRLTQAMVCKHIRNEFEKISAPNNADVVLQSIFRCSIVESQLHGRYNSTSRNQSNEDSRSRTSSTGSSLNYEGDDESYDNQPPAHCLSLLYDVYPELWVTVVSMMKSLGDRLSQLDTVILLDQFKSYICVSTDNVKLALQHDLPLMLLRNYATDVQDASSIVGEVVLSIAEIICSHDITGTLLDMLIQLQKQSNMADHLTNLLHDIIMSSSEKPEYSIAFPLVKGDQNDNGAVITTTLQSKSTTLDCSLAFWIYLDGRVASSYNFADKDKTVMLVSLEQQRLAVILESEVTSGSICLRFECSDVEVGRFPKASVLSTNTWQMVGITINVKSKERQLTAKVAISLDGRVLLAGTETFPTKAVFSTNTSSSSDLTINVGQRCCRQLNEASVLMANIMMYRGELTQAMMTELFLLCPSFDVFTKCSSHTSDAVNIQCLAAAKLHSSLLQQTDARTTQESQLDDLMNAIRVVINPKHQPFCLLYEPAENQAGTFNKLLSSFKGAKGNFSSSAPTLWPVAHDGAFESMSWTGLTSALSCLGGVDVLLFMFAKSVEVEKNEEQQIKCLSCLLHAAKMARGKQEVQTLDYKLLPRILQSSKCKLRRNMTQVLMSYAIRSIGKNSVLVDLKFIEEVLLEWRMWQGRADCWQLVWEALDHSVSSRNDFHILNVRAMLCGEIVQTALRIPLQYLYHPGANALEPMPLNFIIKMTSIASRVLRVNDMNLLGDLCRLILLLHPAAAMFIQYDNNKLFLVQHWALKNRQDRETTPIRIRSEEGVTWTVDNTLEQSFDVVDVIPPNVDTQEGSSSNDFSPGSSPFHQFDSQLKCSTTDSTPETDMSTDTSGENYNVTQSLKRQTAVTAENTGVSGSNSHLNALTSAAISELSASVDDSQTPDFDVAGTSYEDSGTSCREEAPDIIISHHEFYEQECTIENGLNLLSSRLIQILLDMADKLSFTDKRIFYSDLMPLDTLTVLLNHENEHVRLVVLKLFCCVVNMSTKDQLESFIKKRGFHLVASQLHQWPASDVTIQLCCALLRNAEVKKTLGYKLEFTLALVLPLMGSLDRCCYDITLTNRAFSFLFEFMESSLQAVRFCVRNGITEVLCNCLASTKENLDNESEDDMDRMMAYMTSFYQKIILHYVRMMELDNIKSLINLHIMLERHGLRALRGNNFASKVVPSRLQSLIRMMFHEIFMTLSHEAKGVRRLGRMRSLLNLLPSSPTKEDKFPQSSADSQTNTFRERKSSTESKVSPAGLIEILLYLLPQYTNYALYRAISTKCDKVILPSLTELLLDVLLCDEENTTWMNVLAAVNVCAKSQMCRVLAYLVSESCDQETVESTVNQFIALPISKQQLIIHQLQLSPALINKIRGFVSCHQLKSQFESFLRSLLSQYNKYKTGSSEKDDLTQQKSHIEQRNAWKKQLDRSKKIVFHRLDHLVKDISCSAMDVNKDLVYKQNIERKKFIKQLKSDMASDVTVRKKWQNVIEQLTHERAVWYEERSYPQSWEIDPTEGPGRVRKRMQRCHLKGIAPRFMLPDQQYKCTLSTTSSPLEFLFEDSCKTESASAALIYRLHTNESISYTCKCSNITPNIETSGDLLISDHCVHFVGDEAIIDHASNEVLLGRHELLSISWPLDEIKGLHKRRFQLQDSAIEIFLTCGRTSLLALDSTKERDMLWEQLYKLKLPSLINTADLERVQKQWLGGQMTNFDYLTHLNTLAGRSFNDLMQYPVFPFILSQYSEDCLDLNNPTTYRDLGKPIACQIAQNEEKFKAHYEAIAADIALCESVQDKSSHTPLAPYHYASHYSNSGIVLHYLVRLLPYTQMFLKYQDGQFDIPDRTFHSMNTSWLLSSEKSTTDVKELIPEFFYLPEFITNYEGFDFGKRHTGEAVHDLNLPIWSKHDARLFVLILRQALENEIVSKNLHLWINLIFGYQQQGKAAEEAINKFHPSTYYGLEVNAIEDELQKNAIKVMIKTYGQMPKQLFFTPHLEQAIQTSAENQPRADVPQALDSVVGLVWGNYIGSPADRVQPKLVTDQIQYTRTSSIVAIPTGEIIGLAPCTSIVVHETKSGDEHSHTNSIWAAMLTWNQPDGVIRLKNKKDRRPINFLHVPHKVTCCASVDSHYLFVACNNGSIQVHETLYSRDQQQELRWQCLITILTGHKASVTCMKVCSEYSIIVSGDGNGVGIIWDLNKLTYVTSFTNQTGKPITAIAVSPTLGDITTCSRQEGGSCLELFTINAKPVASLYSTERINCLCYSTAPEGKSVNVIAGGLSTGVIRLWSSWNLRKVNDISSENEAEPITCVTFTPDCQRLAATTSGSRLLIWERAVGNQLSLRKVRYIPLE